MEECISHSTSSPLTRTPRGMGTLGTTNSVGILQRCASRRHNSLMRGGVTKLHPDHLQVKSNRCNTLQCYFNSLTQDESLLNHSPIFFVVVILPRLSILGAAILFISRHDFQSLSTVFSTPSLVTFSRGILQQPQLWTEHFSTIFRITFLCLISPLRGTCRRRGNGR